MKNVGVLFLLVFSQHISAQEYMIIGGGYGPLNSEASIERNVLDIKKVIGNRPKTVFFASGSNPDICDVSQKTREANPILFQLFNFSQDFRTLYQCTLRHNKVNPDFPAEKKYIVEALKNHSQGEAKSALKIFYTGHGGYASTYTNESIESFDDSIYSNRLVYNNNLISLWTKPNLSVREFSESLDALNPNQSVQVIMTQCYSGGFAQIIYEGGDFEAFQLAPHNRCGFFSQTPYALAAGCTDDLNNDREYTQYFLKAMRNNQADYDGDGTVSAAEGHAYVIINSESIDVPISTSDQLLFDYMVYKKLRMNDQLHSLFLGDLREKMTELEQHIFNGLVTRLSLRQDVINSYTYDDILDRISELEGTLDEHNSLTSDRWSTYSEKSAQVQRYLLEKYPLAFAGSLPFAGTNDSEERAKKKDKKSVEKYLKDNDVLADLKKLYDPFVIQKEHFYDIERKIAVWDRLLWLLQTVIYRNTIVDETIHAKYKQLTACENQPFF